MCQTKKAARPSPISSVITGSASTSIRGRKSSSWLSCPITAAKACVTGLANNTDYEFYLENALGKRSCLRLVRTAPALCTYIELIRAQKEFLSGFGDEFGILDLGHQSIRMYMFKQDRHVATRALEMGLSNLDTVLEEAFSVDVHLAHTYLMTNYENCQQRDECRAAYENIAVELMRAMNFYRFSNPQSVLSDLWLCGGGAGWLHGGMHHAQPESGTGQCREFSTAAGAD